MAKKRFTDDLFGLFEDPAPEQDAQGREPAVPASEAAPAVETEQVEVKVSIPSPRARRKLSSKGFTADLDAFLSDSFAREAAPASPPPGAGGPTSTAPAPAPGTTKPPRPRRRRKSGLDLLIQSTVTDEDRSPRGDKSPDTKRVTLIFNKEHLVELKQEAKERGVYLKDVVQEMVSSYLDK